MNQILLSKKNASELNKPFDKINNINYDKNNINKNNKHKPNKIKYISLFSILIFCLISFASILFYKIYQNYVGEKISKKLNNSYSVSTLYSNNTTNSNINSSTYNSPFIIGILKIDKINLNYSIISVCNKELLDISLCRFAGPMPNEVGNLCIAGHNYVDYKFFSRLNELKLNDKIQIYDLSGKYQEYSIYDIYETIPSDTSCTFQNTNNKKIVTLITCNNVNGKRLIIHAKEIPTK
jgi:LPXTG-site transpeptidase (sortase) family protein